MEQQTTQCIGQVFFGHMFFKGAGFKKETGTQMVATLFGKAVIQQNSVHGIRYQISNIFCLCHAIGKKYLTKAFKWKVLQHTLKRSKSKIEYMPSGFFNQFVFDLQGLKWTVFSDNSLQAKTDYMFRWSRCL